MITAIIINLGQREGKLQCNKAGKITGNSRKTLRKIVTRFMCVCANCKLNDNNTISSLTIPPSPTLLLPLCLSHTAGSASRLPSRRCIVWGGVAWKYFKCEVSAQFSTVCRVNPHARALPLSRSLSLSLPLTHLQPLNGNRMWAEAEAGKAQRRIAYAA